MPDIYGNNPRTQYGNENTTGENRESLLRKISESLGGRQGDYGQRAGGRPLPMYSGDGGQFVDTEGRDPLEVWLTEYGGASPQGMQDHNYQMGYWPEREQMLASALGWDGEGSMSEFLSSLYREMAPGQRSTAYSDFAPGSNVSQHHMRDLLRRALAQ